MSELENCTVVRWQPEQWAVVEPCATCGPWTILMREPDESDEDALIRLCKTRDELQGHLQKIGSALGVPWFPWEGRFERILEAAKAVRSTTQPACWSIIA